MICAHCRQTVQSDWTYCPYCGAQERQRHETTSWQLPDIAPPDGKIILVTREFDGELSVTEALWDEHHEAFFDPTMYGLSFDGEGPLGEIEDVKAWMSMPAPYQQVEKS
jgi:hypothetical protein